MANKGGYQIISLQRKPLYTGGSSETIPGIYKLISGTKKPILLSGILINDTEYDDEFVIYKQVSDYIFSFHDMLITVEIDDSVSVEYK